MRIGIRLDTRFGSKVFLSSHVCYIYLEDILRKLNFFFVKGRRFEDELLTSRKTLPIPFHFSSEAYVEMM